MGVYEEKDYNSDEEVNKKQHARLLEEVLQLDQRPYVRKPTRTEPTTHVSEFNLVKSNHNLIKISDLAKTLKQKTKHVAIGNKLKSAQKKAHTLHKPLEKPQAERIRRSIGFTKTTSELNKWNSIVDKNRVASQIIFPLRQGEIDFVDPAKQNKEPVKRYKSDLDRALEKLEPIVETIHVEEKFPLSMAEIVERRKEMAKLRAHQSYQEAKAYRKNKIKSKTYHRIQRKEKLRQQIKEFELLQKTDPEEALKKLEQLEKTRVEERMTLRHRSTGQWAKNKQVRAKYDKESRQALAQQLSISREMTQKLKTQNDSDSDIELEEQMQVKQKDDGSNPWISGDKTNEVGDFVSGYRKFWNEKNNKDIDNEKEKISVVEDNKKSVVKGNNKSVVKDNEKQIKNNGKIVVEKIAPEKKPVKKNKKMKITHCSTSWTVTSLFKEKNNDESVKEQEIGDIFDNLEDQIRFKGEKKLSKLKSASQPKKKRKIHEDKEETIQKSDLVFKREKLRPEIDEELGVNNSEDEKSEKSLKQINKTIENDLDPKQKTSNIDPNKYMKVKTVELATKLPNISQGDDNDEEINDQRAYITEAFADDDVINEFNKEKKDTINQDKPKDIDLNLPGWGAWGGKNIKPSKRKTKRFIIKTPQDMRRRDKNKGHLIINEHKDTKIKKHLVSDLPFPFTSVKDFEASIRAPIGDTFVPQTAFRRLIKPSIVTKQGAIIEPMTNDILLKQKFTNNGLLVNK